MLNLDGLLNNSQRIAHTYMCHVLIWTFKHFFFIIIHIAVDGEREMYRRSNFWLPYGKNPGYWPIKRILIVKFPFIFSMYLKLPKQCPVKMHVYVVFFCTFNVNSSKSIITSYYFILFFVYFSWYFSIL